MGYCTTFTLTSDSRGDEINKYLNSLAEDGPDYNLAMLDDWGDNNWGMNAKWYNYDEDMCRLSAEFPDVLFTLTGEGEETTDMWRDWYKSGSRYAHWVADIFIPSNPEEWRV